MKDKKIFYGWWVVFAVFLTQFTIYALVYNTFGLFILPISESLGVSRTSVSTFYTILTMVCLLVTIFPVSKLLDSKKLDAKWIILTGSILFGLSYIGVSKINTIQEFYLMAVVAGIGLACSAYPTPVAIVINSWFIEKRALAMGIAMAGSGMGAVIFTRLITNILKLYDWRRAFFILGLITLALNIPTILLFITKFPHRKGYKPYGNKDDEDIEEKVYTEEELERFSIKNSVLSSKFWLFFIGWFIYTFSALGLRIVLAPYLQDLNYSEEFTTTIISLTALLLIPGKPLIGWIFERFNMKKGLILACSIMSVSILLLLTNNKSLVYLFAILFGFGSSLGSVGQAMFPTEIFKGNPNFASLMTLSTLGGGIAGSIGGTVLTAIYEKTNSYLLVWIIILMGFLISMALVFLSLKVAEKESIDLE